MMTDVYVGKHTYITGHVRQRQRQEVSFLYSDFARCSPSSETIYIIVVVYEGTPHVRAATYPAPYPAPLYVPCLFTPFDQFLLRVGVPIFSISTC